jgi:hypothetical protein
MALSRRLSALVRPDLVTAAARFPAPVAMALLATVLIALSIEEVIPRNSERLERALYGAGAVFLAGVACGILLEGGRAVWRVAGQLAAVALGTTAALALYSLWLMPPFLIASLALLVIAAPGFAAGGTPIRFWVFNVRSAFAALVGAVGAGAFVFGFWAILATLRALFDLSIPHRLVGHAAAVGFVLVLPLYWLAFQPRVQDLDAEEPPSDILLRAVVALTDFVFLPLLVIYTVILHAYAAKIAIEAALPRGQIGWMASIFLGLGYFVFLLAVPQLGRLARLRESFRLAWPPATLVPAGLLALALRERVQAYGVTEERYLIGVAAVMAVLLFLAWLPRRRLDPRLVPTVAAGLLLVAAAGPLSAPFQTARSQASVSRRCWMPRAGLPAAVTIRSGRPRGVRRREATFSPSSRSWRDDERCT